MQFVGRDRCPSLEDRDSLNYVQAVIHESLRISVQTYFAIPRESKTDIHIVGKPGTELLCLNLISRIYFVTRQSLTSKKAGAYESCTIPSGSHVLPNFWSVMRDPQYWSEPDTFKPERFLDTKNGGKFRPDKRVIEFGTGARYAKSNTTCDGFKYFYSQILKQF